MTTNVAFLSLTQDELYQLYQAQLSRFLVENSLRREQGLELIDPPPILERLEAMLGLNPEEAHQRFHAMEDELWQYSWFTYTDEWAWYRARQDVLKKIGPKTPQQIGPDDLETLIERRYATQFENYISEVDMHESEQAATTQQQLRKTRQTKRHH